MPYTALSLGSSGNDGTGEGLRSGGIKLNAMLSELYGGVVATSAKTANYTLVAADAGTTVEMGAASALTLTVPTNAAVAFTVGTTIQVRQTGAGSVTVAGSGITFRTPGSLTTRTTWSAVVLTKRGTDEWIVEGDTA